MKAVVFVDVTSPATLQRLRNSVEKGYDAVELVDVSQRNTAALMPALCERYGGDSQPSDRRREELDDLKQCLVCYVSESKTIADADVSYAVFVAEIPTLLLKASESSHGFSPLLHIASADTDEACQKCIDSFFTVSTHSPPVIVIEGGDGAGKQTQTALLVEHLEAAGSEVHTLDFPHDQGLYGGLIRVVLSGKKGSISELHPQLFSFLYSLNRFGCARLLHFWLRRGCTVVLDRYYTANFGHQASKLPLEEREGFIDELVFTEVEWLGVPKATAVLYLDLPPAAALEAMKLDTTRKQLDIHETAGGDYKEKVRQTYMWCCEHLANWHRIQCFSDDGQRLSRAEVFSTIVECLKDTLAGPR